MKIVYFVRHGETEFNRQKRLQGWRDSPLSDAGRAQAERVALAVQTLEVSRGLVSPLGRARQTAEIIQRHKAVSLEPSDDLREISFGDFEGNTLDEIEVKFPGQWERRQSEKWTYCPPGGEANRDALPRALNVIARIEADSDDAPWLIVAHFAINRLIFSTMAGLEPEEIMRVYVPHEAIYRAVREEGGPWRISYWDVRENGAGFQDGVLIQQRPENQPMGA